MKKLISFLLLTTFTLLCFTGCKNTKNIEAETVIKDFITKMYVIEDYHKLDMEDLDNNYPKDKYTNELRKIATEDALKYLTIQRLQLMYIMQSHSLHVNTTVTSTKIDKHVVQNDGSVVYNYSAKLKLTFKDKGEEKEEEAFGQVTVKKVENKWVITQINQVSIDSILKYREKK